MLDINSIWQIIAPILVFLFGIGVANIICGYFNITLKRTIYLYLWHTLFCFLYAWYITKYGGDAIMYYSSSIHQNTSFAFGTEAVKYLTYFFSNVLRLSFLATSLVYNIIGFIGLLAFDSALSIAVLNKQKYIRKIATLIIFLPSVSFWSSGIGKDSIAFMSTGLALWAALNFKRRVWMMVPAVMLMSIVRPHIAGILILSFAVSFIIQKRISPILRFTFGAIAIIVSIILVPIGLKYSSVDNKISSSELNKYINQRAKFNMEGGGSIDISKMTLPIQIGTYLFRPFPFEAHSFPSFAASIDNLVLFYLFILGIKSMIQKTYKSYKENRLFMWTYSLITLLILSTTTANLGISVRQKWMFTPMLIFLMISVIGNKKPLKR